MKNWVLKKWRQNVLIFITDTLFKLAVSHSSTVGTNAQRQWCAANVEQTIKIHPFLWTHFKEVVFAFVNLSCLSTGSSKKSWTDSDEFLRGVECLTGNSWLGCGGDLVHNANLRLLKEFFHSRIRALLNCTVCLRWTKRPWWRFVVSSCFHSSAAIHQMV